MVLIRLVLMAMLVFVLLFDKKGIFRFMKLKTVQSVIRLLNARPEILHNASVLKLNFTKNFVTGIYPYSMMLSAFTILPTLELSKTCPFRVMRQNIIFLILSTSAAMAPAFGISFI